MTKQLTRSTLTTSRLLDFFSEKELVNQTGHPTRDWPLVLLKELLDNAIDACEDAGTAPIITVKVDGDGVTISDNGPGLPADTVAAMLDFGVRVSSREHYASPTRGAQGNALKTIVAMPFVLDSKVGRVDITARGILHEIHISVDQIKQEPMIDHDRHQDEFVKNGTSVKVYWPNSSSSILQNAKTRFLQIAYDFTFLNPHLTLTLDWHGEQQTIPATASVWKKWLPSDPTSPHWYTVESFSRLVAGYIADDEDNGRDRMVRELVAEFDGLTGTAKQKAILDATGLSRAGLSALRNGNGLDTAKVSGLLKAMQSCTRPVKASALGIIGREHLERRFRDLGCEMETFIYRKTICEKDNTPSVVEVAFATTRAGLDGGVHGGRRLISGINWSPAVAANPFRQLGQVSLDSILQEQRAGNGEPVVVLIHLASNVRFLDRAKSAIALDTSDDDSDRDDDL